MNRHLVTRYVGPSVRVVVVPGIPVHTTETEESEQASHVSNRPWPGLFECEEHDEDCQKQLRYASLQEGDTCPDCGHVKHETEAHHYHGYIDYAIDCQDENASGEPIAAGEPCKCPCHEL